MKANEVVWVDEDAIKHFPLDSSFKSSLEKIAQKDSPGKRIFTHDVPAIDLDAYEQSLHSSSQRETVDAVVGISNERQGRHVNARLLLTELKLNTKNINGVTINDLRDKQTKSCNILSALAPQINIDPLFCIIYPEEKFQQVYNNFKREQNAKSFLKNWKTFSPRTFLNLINAGNTFPYTPAQETQEVALRMTEAASANNFERLEKAIDHAIEYNRKLKLRNLIGDSLYLSTHSRLALDTFDQSTLDDETRPLFTLLLEIASPLTTT